MKNLILLFVAVVLFGCSTSYQKQSFKGGFSETQLQTDVYIVRFKGNGYTSSEKSSDFCMLRCADLCLQQGYVGFLILDKESRIKKTVVDNGPSTTTGTLQTYGNTTYGSFNTYGGGTTTWHKPRNSLTIKLLKENQEGAFDAAFIRNSIRSKYKMKEEAE